MRRPRELGRPKGLLPKPLDASQCCQWPDRKVPFFKCGCALPCPHHPEAVKVKVASDG